MIIPQYLNYLLESDLMQNEMLNRSMGTSVKNMRPSKELKQLFLLILPLED